MHRLLREPTHPFHLYRSTEERLPESRPEAWAMATDHRPAVKLSVSLPEALKAQLDRYATEHDLSVSQTVQQALEAFFQPAQPAPGPEPGQDVARLEKMVLELGREVQDVRGELVRTRQVLDQHREFLLALRPLLDLAGVALTLPPSLLP